MHRFIILFIFVWVGCHGAQVDECLKLFHPRSSRCCKSDPMKRLFEHNKDVKECFHGHKGPPPKHAQCGTEPPPAPPCDVEVCIANKKGYLNEDGTINKVAVKDGVEKDFADNPTLVSRITEKCIEGDLDNYAPPDFCDLHKLRHCILLQSLNSCPEWDEENEDCSEIKDLVEKCQV